jgi:hypothetical protein
MTRIDFVEKELPDYPVPDAVPSIGSDRADADLQRQDPALLERCVARRGQAAGKFGGATLDPHENAGIWSGQYSCDFVRVNGFACGIPGPPRTDHLLLAAAMTRLSRVACAGVASFIRFSTTPMNSALLAAVTASSVFSECCGTSFGLHV